MKKYPSITNFERYDSNPFINDHQAFSIMNNVKKKNIIPRSKTSYDKAVIDTSTGELEATISFVKWVEVDETQFVKLYVNQLKAMFDLSPQAIRVFAYILNAVKHGTDSFIFRKDDCKKFTGYQSDAPINKGLSNLLEANFIAKTKYVHEYYINVTYFFNGNRISLVKEYYKKGSAPKEEDEKASTVKDSFKDYTENLYEGISTLLQILEKEIDDITESDIEFLKNSLRVSELSDTGNKTLRDAIKNKLSQLKV